MYRYAEQVRGAGLSLPNNIAEGSGSVHPKEFKQFLNITRRSLFEDASMLLVFERLGLIDDAEVSGLLGDCDVLSRKVTNFSRSLERPIGRSEGVSAQAAPRAKAAPSGRC